MDNVVYQVYEKKENEEAFAVLKCCQNTKKSIFTYEVAALEGSFDCQGKAVLFALHSLVSLLLHGLKDTGSITLVTLTISQLIKFNVEKDTRKVGKTTERHHSQAFEAPISIDNAF